MRIFNKQANFEYRIKDTFEAGIVLSGAEVKSLRAGRVDLAHSYVKIIQQEIFLINAYIFPFLGATKDYDPKKTRKLLMHKTQIRTLLGKVSTKGMALVPISIYSKNNYFKVQVGIGETKKKFDHRREIKEQDEQRKLEQEIKDW